MERLQQKKKQHDHRRYYEVPETTEKPRHADDLTDEEFDEIKDIIDEALSDNETYSTEMRRKEGIEMMRESVCQELGYIALGNRVELPVAS